MRNDQLNGNGSPDEAASQPKIRLICGMCSQPYFATSGIHPAQCVSCTLSLAEADAGLAAHERKRARRRAVVARISNKLAARVIACVIVLGIAGVIVAMRTIQHSRDVATERHRAAATGNVFVIKTSNFKWKMCHCEDPTCANQVKAEFDAWKAAEAPPDDDDVQRAAKAETNLLLRCYDQQR